MNTTINQHGEKVTVIGAVSDGKGGRVEVKVIAFKTSFGKTLFSLHGTGGGHPDSGKFETQVKRAKRVYGDESMKAEWYC
jgi:hypothetical protein